MRVKTDYEGCEYITAGKEYEVVDTGAGSNLGIDDDNGHTIIIRPEGCAHLNSLGTWEVLE